MESEQTDITDDTGKIENTGVLDFSGMKSDAELEKIKGIKNVGVILIPESLQHALAGISMMNVGATVPIPDGANVSVQTGMIKMTGEAFATCDEDAIMVLVGMVFVTSRIETVAAKQLIVSGQILAPVGSEAALGAGISRLTGQVIYYSGDVPKLFIGEDSLASEYFGLLENKISMIIVGEMTLESDVTTETLKEKVSGILLVGKLRVPRKLLATVQYLTTEKMGVYEVTH